jgi:hypothetical protein
MKKNSEPVRATSARDTGQIVLKVLNPSGEIKPLLLRGLTNPRVTDLSGKKIGIIWDGKQGGNNFWMAVEELLKERFPATTILSGVWGDSSSSEKVKEEADTFIFGVGDSASGITGGVSKTMALEDAGKPGIFVFVDNILSSAKVSAETVGLPTMRMVTIPGIEYYRRRESFEGVRPIAEAVINDIVDALTRPLTPEESNPKPKIKKDIDNTIDIAAENYETALNKFNQLFLDNHWGDGLPLIPPTEEAVRRMLTGTNCSSDEVLGRVSPLDGIATIEKIAINAVMAGAMPEYLPVIIAAIEGLTDPSFALRHVMVSAGSFTLVILVSGPIARKINMNSGIGLLGHGWQANNTIGRAVRLSLLNIGHLWPAELDMALIGRPSPHTFYTFAENEELSPWEPYHVSQGYQTANSCVTVSTVSGHGGIRIYGGGAVEPWTAESVLNNIIQDLAEDRKIFGLYKPGVGNPLAHPRKHIIVLHPEVVFELQRLGFSRKSMRDYILECTSVPYETLTLEEIKGMKDRIAERSGAFYGADVIPEERIPAFKDALKPGGKVPVIVKPEDIHIIVAGGIPGYSFGMSYMRTAHQTKLLRYQGQ